MNDASAPAMTAAHVERETLQIDANIPAHDARVTTPIFARTRALLIAREGGRCHICGQTAEETGHPLEAHHHPIERCFAAEIDFALVYAAVRSGNILVPERQLAAMRAFDWTLLLAAPSRWVEFVDDMTVNGLLICKDHHTAVDDGIHTIPAPIWYAQRFAKEGTKFNSREVIHHDQVPAS
jgi:hypothetical protein